MRPTGKKPDRLPTMNDVAKLAGVSQTTVSFVVNNVPNKGIPEETRQRILAAIKQLGYRPNAFAKSLRLGRSNILGFLTDEIATSPYTGKIIQGAQAGAGTSGKILFLANTCGDSEVEQLDLETMLEHQVDGIIYATMSHHEITPLPLLYEIPCVLLNCYDSDRAFPSVVPDEMKSALHATKILLETGHRRIALVNCSEQVPGSVGRLQGYQQALQDYGIPLNDDFVCYGESNADSGFECTMQLVQQLTPPTAIFCFNDQMAMGVYQALRELNLRVPDDVAVMGFDNLEIIAAFLRPKLSTMELPHYEMGQWAVNYLVQSFETKTMPEPVQQRIECRYIARASV
jgi:LacI family transcriptional regulator